jgi:hypothetical protein
LRLRCADPSILPRRWPVRAQSELTVLTDALRSFEAIAEFAKRGFLTTQVCRADPFQVVIPADEYRQIRLSFFDNLGYCLEYTV